MTTRDQVKRWARVYRSGMRVGVKAGMDFTLANEACSALRQVTGKWTVRSWNVSYPLYSLRNAYLPSLAMRRAMRDGRM